MKFERRSQGKVFGENVEICKESYLCKNSFATERADIWESFIETSRICFDSKIRRSKLKFSTVGSESGKCEVTASHLINTRFHGGTALNCYIENSTFEGAAYCRNAKVINSLVKDSAFIEGGEIVGITLEKFMRVGCGVWHRQPRYLEINTDEIQLGVTESINGYAYIRCQHKQMDKWLKKKRLFQKAVGWSDEVVEQLVAVFEEWIDEPV